MFAKLAMLALGAAVFRNENPYAAFGVHNAVLTSDNIEDHRQNMLDQDVAVRDGDDAITLDRSNESGVVVTDRVADDLDTEGRIEIQIPDGPNQIEPQVEADADTQGEDQGEEGFGEQLGEAPDELVQASSQIAEYTDGLASMKAQAIENGLSADAAAKMEAEYERDSKLSDESLKALEAAGFKPAFVKSFLQGQESIATAYVNSVIEYAGGKATFDKLIGHLQTNSPETVEVLEDAIQRQDLKAIKATINLAKSSHKAKFGAPPARNVSRSAPAIAARAEAAPQVEAFKSSAEMVKAMSDRRYATDPAYRAQVQAKVHAM
jgi:hypothetical protein